MQSINNYSHVAQEQQKSMSGILSGSTSLLSKQQNSKVQRRQQQGYSRVLCFTEEISPSIETFSIGFFLGNCKPQTAKCHVTTALRSRLQFAVHVWTAGRASSGKWFTARFFATKNCTASRLKVWTSFLYPFAMCLLDFWSRINELLLIFGRLKWCTSTWWKQHGGPKQWTRSSNQFYIPFCRTNKGKYSVPIQS